MQRRQHEIGRRDQQLDDRVAPIRVADRLTGLGKNAFEQIGDRCDFVGADCNRNDRQRARLQCGITGAREEILQRRDRCFGSAGIHQSDALGRVEGKKSDPGRAIGARRAAIREHDPGCRQRSKRLAQLRGDTPLG